MTPALTSVSFHLLTARPFILFFFSLLISFCLSLLRLHFPPSFLPNCPLPPFQSGSCLHPCSSPGIYIVNQVQNVIWFLYFGRCYFLQTVKKVTFFFYILEVSSDLIIYQQALGSRIELNLLPLLLKHGSQKKLKLSF